MVCNRMKKHKLIKDFKVDKDHVTNVIIQKAGGKDDLDIAIPILHPSDFVDVLPARVLPLATPIIHEIFPAPEPDFVPDFVSVQERSTATAPSSRTSGSGSSAPSVAGSSVSNLTSYLEDPVLNGLASSQNKEMNALANSLTKVVDIPTDEDENQMETV